MKLFKTLALTAALVLMASTAFGASTPRVVRPGLVQDGDRQIVTLFHFPNIALTTTDNCLAFSATTDDACANYALNTQTTHRPFMVTNIATTIGVSGDAASVCALQLEIDGTLAGRASTFSAVTIGTTTNAYQNYLVPAGVGFSVNVSDSSGCYDNTAPTATFTVEGYYLD
jgi:hypothetical protein